ncbi:hypothetical protein B296_00039077 [Ensete ventricosum]|uniref:Uncharacterized protein n=1 Tax=Ensete ventricosum TaxID=4639 RepID=A0A426YK26_ENSVE|nr:hypothetical protein B296_00039077 [Ensete ventricosum]
MIYSTHYKSFCTSMGQGDGKETNPRTNLIFGGVTSRAYPTRPSCRSRRPTRTGVLPLHSDSTTLTADLPIRALNHYTSGQAPTSYREDHGRLAYTGLNQRVLAQQTRRSNASTASVFWKPRSAPKLSF